MFLRDSTSKQGKEAVNRALVNIAMSRVDSEPNYNALSRKNVQIHGIPWKCPPKFAMDCDWHVAVAGETPEVKRQIYREARVHEAIYPHPLAIPPNPSEAPEAHYGNIDESQVPPISLTPIEEREESNRAAPPEESMGLQALGPPRSTLEAEHRGITLNNISASLESHGVDVETAVAAAAFAYTALLKCNEEGSLIDPDLLITFLKNPELIKKHIDDQRVTKDAPREPPLVVPTFSWTTSVSYKRSASNEEFIDNLINESAPHSVNQNAPMALTSGACPLLRPQIPVSSLHVVPKAVTAEPGSSATPHCPTGQSMRIPSSSFHCVPPQNICPNAPSLTMTGRADVPSLYPATQKVPQGAPSTAITAQLMKDVVPKAVTAVPGPSGMPHLRSLQNVRPSGTSSFHCIPPQSIRSHVSSATMTGRPDISSSDSVPQELPQGTPSVAITAQAVKDVMGYLKGLVQEYGNRQETPKIDQVEVGQSQNQRQDLPLISIGKQPMYGRPLCKFFSTPSGCRYGTTCQFQHSVENLPTAETPKIDQVEVGQSQNQQQDLPLISIGNQPMYGRPLCKFFSTPSGCKYGTSCRFQHSVENMSTVGTLLQEGPASKRMKPSGGFSTMK